MSPFKDVFEATRRTFILRFLVETDGEAIESVIYKAVSQGFHTQTTREIVRGDLDHLREARCITEDYSHPAVCLVTLTERGDDAACGKIDVPGVERSRWKRG